jgi:hypothetical protein
MGISFVSIPRHRARLVFMARVGSIDASRPIRWHNGHPTGYQRRQQNGAEAIKVIGA